MTETSYPGEDFFCYTYGDDGICDSADIMNPSNKSSLPGIPTSPYVSQSHDRAQADTESMDLKLNHPLITHAKYGMESDALGNE